MRVKEQHLKEQDELLNQNLSFEEWLDHFISKEPTDKELDDMEKESLDKRGFYYPINNPHYQPLQGA
jgi:hypothetical protein